MKQILFIVIVLFTIMACNNSPNEKIQGRWKFISGNTPRNPKDSSVVLETYAIFGYMMAGVDYIEFTKDEVFIIGKKGDTLETYVYTIRNDTIVSVDNKEDTTKFKFEIKNKELRMYNEKGALYEFTKK